MLEFSVVIPTYNGAAFVADALRSVLDQTHPAAEVLVVDDASTDNTVEVIRAVSESANLPVRVLAQGENSGGPAHPINVGVAAARCEWVSVLDQDDVFVADRFQTLANALADCPEADWLFTSCGLLHAPQRPGEPVQSAAVLRRLLRTAKPLRLGYWLEGFTVLTELLGFGNFVVGWPGFVFRRRAWEAKGGLDESLRIGSDFDMVCWLALKGGTVFLPERLYLRRTHAQNLSRSGIRCPLEVARITHRYAAQALPRTTDHTLQKYLVRHYERMLITLGWAGWHAEAFRRLGQAAWTWGWNHDTHWTAAKLGYTWMWRNVLRRSYLFRTPELMEYLTELDAIQQLLTR